MDSAVKHWGFTMKELEDGTMWLLNQIEQDISNDFNIYMAITSRRFGAGKCLDEDTEIVDPLTGFLCTIKDFHKKHALFAYSLRLRPTCGIVASEVSNSVHSGMKSCFKLTTNTGRSITASVDHKFLTAEGWQCLSDLTVGQTIALPARIPFPHIQIPMNDAEIVIIAVLMAEGNLTNYNAVRFDSEEPKILQTMAIAVAKLGTELVHYDCDKPTTYHVRSGVRRETNTVKVMLEKHGLFGVLSKNKIIPEAIFRLPKEQLAKFIAYFWQCDGYIDRSNPAIVLASKKLVCQLQHLLLRFGIQSRVAYKASKCNGKVFDAWRLTVYAHSINNFLSEIPIWGYKRNVLERLAKRTRNPNVGYPTVSKNFVDTLKLRAIASGASINELTNEIGWKHSSNLGYSHLLTTSKQPTLSLLVLNGICNIARKSDLDDLRWLASPEIFWDKIVSIESIGERDTYDLSVPLGSSFVANDVIVHNSDSAITLAWMYDKFFHDANIPVRERLDICYGETQADFARTVERRKRHFFFVWEESQDQLHSTQWMELDPELRKFITSQRGNGVNIIWPTPKFDRLWFTLKDSISLLLHLKLRCKFHCHGMIFVPSDNPLGDDWEVKKTFTFPKPTDPDLIAILEEYHKKDKQDYMDARSDDFVVKSLYGGRGKERAVEFAKWYLKNPSMTKQGEVKAPTKILVKIWCNETRQAYSDSEMEEIYGYAKRWIETGEIEDVIKEAKGKAK